MSLADDDDDEDTDGGLWGSGGPSASAVNTGFPP